MATDAQDLRPAPSLPGPVLKALSFPGVDAARFCAVVEAFGPLPEEAQVDLANRLILARGQYVAHRMSVCDSQSGQGVRRKRLEELGAAAKRLRRLLHRDGADPKPWNLHPAISLALPRLFEISAEHRSDQIWADQGLTRFAAMLTDLAEVGTEAETIFPAQFPSNHGGRRRKGSMPETGLIENLIVIYAAMQAKSGPEPKFDAQLKRFVRMGLAFAVSSPPEIVDSEGRRYQLFEARFLETDLPEPSRITDEAIRGVFDRWHSHKPSRRKT
jgi:hypothetical protein